MQNSLPRRYTFGLSLISACILALEVTLTRIFSITIWYHFAYLVVGLALLGGGAAGTFLSIKRWDAATLHARLSTFALLFSISVLLTLGIVAFVPIDPLNPGRGLLVSLIGLVLLFVAVLGMFFLGGLTVTAVFRLGSAHAHRLYFADLLGASIATLLITLFIRQFSGPGVLLLVALGSAVVAALFCNPSSRWQRRVSVGGAGLLFVAFIYASTNPIHLPVPQSKELGWLSESRNLGTPELTVWNSIARIDVTRPDMNNEIWIAGGVSSVFAQKENRAVRFMTFDGTSLSAIHSFEGGLSSFGFLEHVAPSAPFKLGYAKPSVLNIGVGGGLDLIMSRYYSASNVVGIELNSDAVNVLKTTYAQFSGNLADDPNTQLIAAEGRSFLTRDTGKYDIIQGIALDNFAALSGGAYVMAESYIYTVESVDLALEHLTDNGVFAWTRSTNNPPREMLRLVGLVAESLRKRGIQNVAQHMVIIANENEDVATMLVKRTPISENEMQNLRAWTTQNKFPLLHDPFNTLDTQYAEYLHSADPRAFEAAYPFNIYPVTDDSPFFYNYFKWTNLLQRSSGGDVNNAYPIGNIILFVLLGLSAAAAVGFVIVPLVRHKRGGLQQSHALAQLAYFSALGAGYMFVQVILIQRFTLFIGYPTQAITTTIFGMLLFSALGSLMAARWVKGVRELQMVLGVVVVLVAIYTFGLAPVLRAGLALPDSARTVIAVLLIAPLAFFMGMPFPTGLRHVATTHEYNVPWAWGMNGVFSVLGSALVVLVSQLSGFSVALLVGAAWYALAAGLATRLGK